MIRLVATPVLIASFASIVFSAGYSDSIITIRPGPSPLVFPPCSAIDTALFTGKLAISLTPEGTYAAAKTRVAAQKNHLKTIMAGKAHPDSRYRLAQTTLENCIVNELIPFWYGTPWDFNGYTPLPGKGVISCGYFVSTILLHCGFALNRYTLAQQSPYLEAVSLQLSDSIREFRCTAGEFLRTFTKEFKEGLYFAGTENHVGFLLLRSGTVVFLHSSYFRPQCVVVEKAVLSEAFNASATYYIAELSTNRKLLDCWICDRNITIRTE